MAAKKNATHTDASLQQIADLERDLVLGKDQLWAFHGVSAEEIAQVRPAVVAQAKAVCDQLRAEYLARSPKP